MNEYRSEIDKVKFFTHSTIFKDNQGMLTDATSPRYTLTSKFIVLKYHWFRQHTNHPEKAFDLQYIASDLQIANILPKVYREVSF